MDVIREIYRGDIFYVMPGPAYAAEIGTKGRPAVIVSPSPDRTSCETVNVVYLTLGDSTVYCTFSYLQHIMEEDGYEVELVSGITSFCAAAARLGISLTEWNEPLHVIPASHRTGEPLDLPGTYVLMKSASHMRETKELLIASGREVSCVENCGMENEKIYRSAQEIPDDAGYFSLVIAKENNIREKT